MIDDHVDYVKAIRAQISLCVDDLPLVHELSSQWEYRTNINASIVERLVKVSKLDRFMGSLLPGTREGRAAEVDEISLPSWAVSALGLGEVVIQ
ncbi:hypothetical protein K438DRAFT_1587495 [Mycena galopus ATCC 62051]|nr:hypothetical protein K438DRAFT_1587495 [Mycena galopus ATCC 62051]